MRTTYYYDRIEAAAQEGGFALGPMTMPTTGIKSRTFHFQITENSIPRIDVWLDDLGRFYHAYEDGGSIYWSRKAFTLLLQRLKTGRMK